MCCPYEFEPRVVASPAWGKLPTVDAGYFMGLSVIGIVRDEVDARIGNEITRLEDISDISHLSPYQQRAYVM
jgi:hypothetical protein